MLNLNFELLKVFQVVTDHNSVKKAAELLFVTPSAVSQNLKKLETHLGFQLFLREHKKITLTPKGETFRKEILPLMESLENKISGFINAEKEIEPQGTLSVGAPFELGSTLLVQKFVEFKKKNPKVNINLSFGPPLKLLGSLERGEVDFCLAINGPHFKVLPVSITKQKILTEEFVLLIPKKLLKDPKKTPTLEELEKLPHLDYASDGSVVKDWYHFHFHKRPKSLNVVMSSENTLSLLEGVKGGLGVAMIPLERMPDSSHLESCVIFKPQNKRMIKPILLLQHLSKKPSLAEKKFIEFLSL